MRLELSDGKSHKFWEITQAGKALHIRWGRIGTDGQEQTKAFANADAARRELDKLVASKRKKGYAEAGGRATPSKPAAPSAPDTHEIAGGLPATRPRRDRALSWFSDTPLDAALKYPDRVRDVDAGEASTKLQKLRRIFKLQLSLSGQIPAWIGELRHLRTLQAGGGFTALPASLSKLPHLRFLHVDNSNITKLDGIDKLPALEVVTCNDSTLGDDDAALAAQLKRLKRAKPGSFGPSFEFSRKPPKPPRDKKQLVKAINDDTLPDGSDLRKVDLSGARFDDAYITHDLRGAKLANTIWVACDFEWGSLAGADLTGATFYDCCFDAVHSDDGNLGKVKARGATFVGCGGSLELTKADLRGARMLDMDDDVSIDMTGADGQGLVMQLKFVSEKEHRLSMKGADLRGAHLRLDVTAGRRKELAKKNTTRLAWKTDHFKGAKTDKTTRIEYAPLDPAAAAPATRPAARTYDPRGKAAKILGSIYASNASLWLVVADAEVATKWRGAVDDDDPKDDFQRALKIEDDHIAIGDARGVCVRIGFDAWSHVFASDGSSGVRLLDARLTDDKAERDRGIALRMGQWKVTRKPKVIGTFACPSGVVAMMLPYREGAFPPKLRAKAVRGAFVGDPEHDRALVSMTHGPGIYEVVRYPFRPEKGKGATYEDDLGEYGDVIEIAYRDRLPAKYRG